MKPTINIGINDIWTTDKWLGELLTNPDDGYKYVSTSGKKVDFTCPYCKHKSSHRINNVRRQGLSCPICSDGISFPNRFMANLLDSINVDFKTEYTIKGKNIDMIFIFL